MNNEESALEKRVIKTPNPLTGSPNQRSGAWFEARLPERLRDYATVGMALFWQRMLIYASGLAIGAFYIDVKLALLMLVLFALSEVFDVYSFRRILRTSLTDKDEAQHNRRLVAFGAAVNSGTVCLAVLGISAIQGPGTHFMPYFILFAGSLFAAMNSHQLTTVVKVRMILYGTSFIFIPIWDIVLTGATIHSPAWMHLFINAFFLFFMVECARVFLRLYRRQIEQIEELREQHEQVETAYRLKSEFLSTMSHELRTPMTSIFGAVTLSRSGKLGELPPRVDALMEIAEVNCRRLSALINDVLDLQKIEAGRITLETETLELGEFLAAALRVNAPYGNQFNVTFTLDRTQSPIYVEADSGRLEQVMSNLLSNAAKFSHPGDTVTVRLEADAESARILVIDTGIGLDESARDQVFEKFSQVDASDTRRIGGTGLGMNISKRILQEHGATIDYRKNEGPGTTFIVEMKRIPTPKAVPGTARHAA